MQSWSLKWNKYEHFVPIYLFIVVDRGSDPHLKVCKDTDNTIGRLKSYNDKI